MITFFKISVYWQYSCEIAVRNLTQAVLAERDGQVVEAQTPEREVGGSIPTSAVLCP